ncbi:hypothetical protein Tco_0103523, partial [Tanacetum coccineum]
MVVTDDNNTIQGWGESPKSKAETQGSSKPSMADHNRSEQKRPDGNGSEQKTAAAAATGVGDDKSVGKGLLLWEGEKVQERKGKGGPDGRPKPTAGEGGGDLGVLVEIVND